MSKLKTDFYGREQLVINNELDKGLAIYHLCKHYYDNGMSIRDIYDRLDKSCKAALKRGAKKQNKSVYYHFEHYLKNNDYYTLSNIFAKDASKTNWFEKYQLEVLQTQSTYTVYKLNNNGKKSIKLIKSKKTVDFICYHVKSKSGREFTVYINAKYTHEGGGAQDNQLNELESFADSADYDYAQTKNNCKQNDTVNKDGSILIQDGSSAIIVLLADGDYFKKPRKAYGNMNYYQHIASTHASYNHNLIVTTTEDFDDNLSALLSTL